MTFLKMYLTLLICTLLWDFYHVPKAWSGEIVSISQNKKLDVVSILFLIKLTHKNKL